MANIALVVRYISIVFGVKQYATYRVCILAIKKFRQTLGSLNVKPHVEHTRISQSAFCFKPSPVYTLSECFSCFFSLGFLDWLSVPVQLIDWRMIYDHVDGDVKPYSLTDSQSTDLQMNIYTVRQPTTVN